jgi:hypothetical protein
VRAVSAVALVQVDKEKCAALSVLMTENNMSLMAKNREHKLPASVEEVA